MLARVLVAERVFESRFPVIDFDGLAEEMARPRVQTGRAGDRFGASGVEFRSVGCRAPTVKMLTGDAGSTEERVELAVGYSRLGTPAATFVIDLARSSFDSVLDSDSPPAWMFDPVVKRSATVAKWHPTIDSV